MKPEDKIPEGMYCYGEDGMCPYYETMESEVTGETIAFCHFLNESEMDYFLLGDHIKECGINKPTNDV